MDKWQNRQLKIAYLHLKKDLYYIYGHAVLTGTAVNCYLTVLKLLCQTMYSGTDTAISLNSILTM